MLGVSDAVVVGPEPAEVDVVGVVGPDVGAPLVPGAEVPLSPGVDDEGCLAYWSTDGTPDSGSD